MSDTQYDLNRVVDGATNFATDMYRGVVEEWNRRTTYGKLWFPVWFAISAASWLLVAAILAIVGPFALYKKAVTSDSPKSGGPLPDIYRDEDEECETA